MTSSGLGTSCSALLFSSSSLGGQKIDSYKSRDAFKVLEGKMLWFLLLHQLQTEDLTHDKSQLAIFSCLAHYVCAFC